MSEGERIHCPHCDKTVSNELYLRQHINFKHSKNVSEDGVRPSTYKHRYLAVEDYQELKSAARNGQDIILCPYCNHVPFKAKQFLFQHVTLAHSAEPRPKRQKKGVFIDDSLISNDAEREILDFANDISSSVVSTNFVGLNARVSTFSREDNRKSYSNGFKASIIEEIEKGTSRKALSEAYDIPLRTLEKWMKRDHDIILSCKGNVELAGYSRIVRKTLTEKLLEGERSYLDEDEGSGGRRGRRSKSGGGSSGDCNVGNSKNTASKAVDSGEKVKVKKTETRRKKTE